MATGNHNAGMAMMHNNGMQNGAGPRASGEETAANEPTQQLNTWIYSYMMEQKQYDVARALKSSALAFSPPITAAEEELNGAPEDSKHGVLDKQKPSDLPTIKAGIDHDGASLLAGWFSVFWDMWAAHTNNGGTASKAATALMEQNRV